MGEETNAYDPAGSQFGDDVTAERPTDRAAQSGQKAQATARAAEPVKPLISMSDLPDLRNTFNPSCTGIIFFNWSSCSVNSSRSTRTLPGKNSIGFASSNADSSLSIMRSEERRVGKECTSVCRSRWSPYH